MHGWQAQLDPAGEPLGVRSLVPQEGQREVESLDLTAPSLGLGAFPAGEQVGFDLIQPGQHLGVYLQDGASDAGEFVLAGGAVGAAAGTEFHLALVEVVLELGPLCVGGRPVFIGRAQLASPVEECLVVAYELFVEDNAT